MRRGSVTIRLLVMLGLLIAAAVPGLRAGIGGGPKGEDRLTLGAFSVVREALHDGILPAFAEHWRSRTGRTVRFEESYNASGAQARAIAAGFDADIAILSHEGDMDQLVKAKLVDSDWRKQADRGIVVRSLVVIGVRPGNPKGVRDWSDLARPGVAVLYPDPKTSGGARWNINAIYGSKIVDAPKDPRARSDALELLAAVQANVVTMDTSGRQSLATFERGIGDAAVSYENELLLQRKMKGDDAVSYVVPPRTLVIESPAAIVESSVRRHGNAEVAQAFLEFLRSDQGQEILAGYGFRPESGSSETLPLPSDVKPFTVAELGGWKALNTELYGPEGKWTSIFTRGRREAGR